MALNLPTADPVTFYHRPLSNGRVILLANASLPWSLAAAERYARVKGIPLSNILAVAMGTSRLTWTPASNSALRTSLITPLRNLFDSVLAQVVLVAPGVPQKVTIQSTHDIFTYFPASSGGVSIEYLAKVARELDDLLTTYGTVALSCYIGASAVGEFPSVLLNYPSTGGFTFLGSGEVHYRLGVGLPAPLDPAYATTYEGLNAEVIQLPTQLAIDSLGNLANRVLASGRIGASWTDDVFVLEGGEIPTQYHETEASGQALARSCAEYAAAPAPANRYRNPIHLQLSEFYDGMFSLAYLHSQLIGWGYLSSYVWRSNQTAITSPYAPLSGARYTVADLQAGRVRGLPYTLMMGDASNLEMLNEPFVSAWKPTAAGGSMLGPSEGWQYAINGLNRGGSGGYSHNLHVTSQIYQEMYEVAHNLLRGMAWCEAVFYPGQVFPHYNLASGDPLARPFPR